MDKQTENPADDRTLAQFFFEIGYGACFAEAYIRNGNVAPFQLTDALVERAWEIAGEAHDDPEEFDRQQTLADAAPDLLAACEAWDKAEDDRNDCASCENEGPWEECGPCSERFCDAIDKRHAAIKKARGDDNG